MGLFGTDMVDVTTPDGRQMKMPSQLAAGFPGLRPVPPPMAPPLGAPPAIPSTPAVPTFTPTDTADLAALTPSAPPAAPIAPPPAAPAKPRATGTAAQATPTPDPAPVPASGTGPVTNADLAKMGNAGAFNAESAALDKKQEANDRLAQAQANEATKAGAELAARDEKVNKTLEDRAKIASDQQIELDGKVRDYQAGAKELAKQKIDRSVDHPVLAAIGVALAGFGSAVKGESTNPALEIVFKQIDRKVAAQMADLDRKRADLAVQRDAIGMQRDTNRDRLAEYDQHRLAALEQAQQHVETIKAQSQSEQVKANADVVSAGIAQEAAKTLGGYADREHQRIVQEQQRKDQLQMHRDSIGVQYAGLKEQRRHNMAEEDLQQQQRIIEATKAEKAGKADEAKLIRERSMGGEVTPIKDKDGKVTDYQVGLITKKDGSVWIPNGTEPTVTALQKKHNAAVQLVQTLDEIRKLGPEWLTDIGNSDKSQRLKQLMGDARLQAISAKDLGVPTGHDIELAENFLGTSDPTRWRDSLAGIMQSRESIVRDHNVELRNAGLDKDWDPPDTGAKGADAQPGDADLDRVMRKPTNDQWDSELGALPTEKAGGSRFQNGRNAQATSKANAYLHDNGEILPSQKAVLEAWGKAAAGSDPVARDKAVSFLNQVTQSGGNSAIKRFAQQQLASGAVNPAAVFGNSEAPEQTGFHVTGTDAVAVPPRPAPVKGRR